MHQSSEKRQNTLLHAVLTRNTLGKTGITTRGFVSDSWATCCNNRFQGFRVLIPPILWFSIWKAGRSYVRTAVLHCDCLPQSKYMRFSPRTRNNGLKLYNAHCNINARKSFFSERTTLRSLYAISRPSVVCLLSVVCRLSVCDVGAPYSGGWTFRQFFFTIR